MDLHMDPIGFGRWLTTRVKSEQKLSAFSDKKEKRGENRKTENLFQDDENGQNALPSFSCPHVPLRLKKTSFSKPYLWHRRSKWNSAKKTKPES